MNEFYKFPSTPHLANLSSMDIRGDKIFSQEERGTFLSHEIFIEEKIDGACLGISFNSSGDLKAQNRGNYLSFEETGQWKIFWEWIRWRANSLFDVLSDNYILFGEWCYARHSIFYDRLPDWFIGFDIYDKRTLNFLTYDSRNKVLESLDIAIVPLLGKGNYTFGELQKFLGNSQFGDTDAEGIYLRYDNDGWLGERAKLVNPAFMQAIDNHWSENGMEINNLNYMSKVTKCNDNIRRSA